jgi:hypothetical protein
MYFQLVPSTPHTEGTEFGLLPTTRARDGVKGTDRQLTLKNGKWKNLDKNGTAYGMTLEQAIRPEVMLLKTPSAMDAYSENLLKKEQKLGNSGTLAQEIQSGFVYQRGLLHTPRAIHADMEFEMTDTNHKRFRVNDLMNLSLLPTPNQRDENGPTGYNNRFDLNRELGITGRQLNPQFVAEMMGFPVDWLELPFQNTETNQ